MLLTIGQLARHCGVSVRAIRHYHQRGLLAEPARDASGYRRYGAQAVMDLIRIRTLAEAGVPLAQVARLIDADQQGFAAAITEIDDALHRQISDLQRRRRQLTDLMAGDRLVLPAEVADLLAELRELGVSDWSVGVERDGWILLAALSPDVVQAWAAEKLAALRDTEFRRLYLACDEARSLDPADPRLAELAAWMARWAADRRSAGVGGPQPVPDDTAGVSLVETLMTAQFAEASPAWRRLGELSRAGLTPAARVGLSDIQTQR
ncbi:MAG TPA: MerR family DNA-binding transcriptional regulator [Streptosporangiaceae bacterium]